MTKCPKCGELRACIVTGQQKQGDKRLGYFHCVLCGARHTEMLNGRSVWKINETYRRNKR